MKKKDSEMPLTDVAGLMAERQQYEGWLAALAARRDSTPEHVYERVRTDYERRLERVLEKLSSHRAELQERLSVLERRAAGLGTDERTRRDERAELDLRAHVGELPTEAFAKAVAECDREIAEVVAQRATLRDEIQRTREFLDAANRPLTPAAQPAVSSTAPTPPSGAAVVAEPPKQKSVAPTASADLPAMPQSDGEPAEPEPAKPEPAQREPVQPEPVQAEYPQPRTQSGGFDELAFLQQVVGQAPAAPSAPAAAAPTPDPQPPAEATGPRRPSRSSKPDWIAEHSLEPLATNPDMEIIHDEPDTPLAGDAMSNNPMGFRPSGQIEHPKTLKCAECGAFNYPTEWYCERCGAELASL